MNSEHESTPGPPPRPQFEHYTPASIPPGIGRLGMPSPLIASNQKGPEMLSTAPRYFENPGDFGATFSNVKDPASQSVQKPDLGSKFDETLKKVQRKEGMIAINDTLLYADGRAHFVFNDKSAMILHPKGDCFTYFSPDGKKLRQLSRYAVQKDGVLSKLIISMQFVNTYSDDLMLTRQELAANPDHRDSRFSKIQNVYWPGSENFADYFEETDFGWSVSCLEGSDVAKLTLSKNGFLFKADFIALLPFKKPSWVTVLDNEQSAVKSMVGAESQRRLKMAYEYLKISNIHSVT